MKNKSYITKYLIIILPLLFINLNAQDQVDPLEKETATEETESTEVAEEADAVEEFVVKEKSGFSVGVAPSIGLVKGATFTNVPMGATLVITTPYGFKLGPLDFTLSAAFGGYQGEHDGDVFNPSVMGVGGNLTLANFLFAEGHAGIVGEGTGIRGFAGVSLDYLMKKGLGLPVNILVGGEGFITTNASDTPCMSCGEKKEGIMTYWGGLGVRLDYDF